MVDEADADQLELLEETLDETLAGKLGALAAEIDLSGKELRGLAESEATEVLAGVSPLWERWMTAKRKLGVLESELPSSRLGKELRRWWSAFAYARLRDLGQGTLLLALVGATVWITANGAYSVASIVAALTTALIVAPIVAATLRLSATLAPPRPSESDLRSASAEAAAAERNYRSRLADAISAWVRTRINIAEGVSYGTRLRFKDSSGLGEVDDPSHEIPTDARDRLVALIARMPGGAIGLAGTRGAGKSTLMRSICSGIAEPEGAVLGVVVDAPVQYEAREFILHLFAKLCAAVVGPERVVALRNWDRPFHLTAGTEDRRLGYHPALGPALMLLGALLAVTTLEISGVPFTLFIGAMFFLLGYVAAAISLLRDRDRVRLMLRGRRGGSGGREDEEADARAIAERRLRQIWFQQSFSSGWSGALKVPIGLEGGVNASAELSEQQLSLPDVVDLLREFLELVASDREVRIGIDELDKMTDETARQFLNEIKVIFRVPKCFFFVSISEDAMSVFERRGLPFRDVFDSSFDAVLHVPHLRFEDSKALLDRRIVDLPVSFAALLHCMSGGLPRDLIRAARDLVDLPANTSLNEAAKALVGGALGAKAGGAKVQARRLAFGGHVTVLVQWLEFLCAADCEPDPLLDVCRGFEVRFREELGQLPADRPREDEMQLQDMAIQLVAFAYYAATMLQIFEAMDTSESIDAALSPPPGPGKVVAPVDRLAAVSQEFSVDLNTAWEMLSRLRNDLDLGAVAFPKLYLDDPDTVPA